MAQITIQSAKPHLSHLLKRVEVGEEIVIARGRSPVARLVSIEAEVPTGRVFGAAQGLYPTPPEDAFAPLEDDDLSAWEISTMARLGKWPEVMGLADVRRVW